VGNVLIGRAVHDEIMALKESTMSEESRQLAQVFTDQSGLDEPEFYADPWELREQETFVVFKGTTEPDSLPLTWYWLRADQVVKVKWPTRKE
jgi:hypothetical protein